MKKTTLGHSGEQVSSLCLGCMYFGSSIDEEQSFKLLDLYLDFGGTFLDTANNYAYWVKGCDGSESETVLGHWLKARNNRDQIFLATKVGANVPPRRPSSLAYATIMEECEQSLRRLQTDHIDLYYAHIDYRETPLEETLEAFNALVQQGKVRYIGCSNTLAWRIAEARSISRQHGWAEYCCVEQRHTYLRPQNGLTAFTGGQVPVTGDLLDYVAAKRDFAIVAYSALLGGVYSHPQHMIPSNYQPDEYDAADMHRRLQTLRQVADEVHATLNQVVLAWLTQNTPPMIALTSTDSIAQLQENLESTNISLTPEQVARMNGEKDQA